MFDTVSEAVGSAVQAITRHGYYDRTAYITARRSGRKLAYDFIFGTSEGEARDYLTRTELGERHQSVIVGSVSGATYDPAAKEVA